MGSLVNTSLGGALLPPPPLPSLNPISQVKNDAKFIGGDIKQATGQQSDTPQSVEKAQTADLDQPVKQLLGS